MPELKDFLPTPPNEGPPLPRFLTRKKEVSPETSKVQYGACEYGLECIKNHMLRAHLFMTEALRFSANGKITPETQGKITLAREQLLCEDDFQSAMDAPAAIRAETLKLLASTRSTWKAIDKSGLEHGLGSPEDIKQVADAIQDLSRKAYEIDKAFRLSKNKRED